MSRITSTSMSRTSLANMQRTARTLMTAQDRISSGKQVRKPSDGPAQVLSALEYRAQLRHMNQLSRNALDAQQWLDVADSSLTHAIEQLTRARTLTLEGVNGATDHQGRYAIASEIRTIAEGLLQTANTQHLGRPIFSGTEGVAAAYSEDGSYLGNDGSVSRTITSSVSIRVNRTGPEIFGDEVGTGDDPLTGNIFQVLHAIADALEAGDTSTASAGIAAIDTSSRRIETAQVELGSRSKQVEETLTRNEQIAIELRYALAEVEDTDYVEAIIELQAQEMAHQAALAVTAKVIQPSLLDFLR